MPPDLRAEMSRSAALANPVWVEARKTNDFATFLPVLRKNLDLRKRYIDCFEVKDEPYDIVLDDYERDMTTKEVPAHLRLPEGAPGAARQGGRGARRQRAARRTTSRSSAQKVFELEVVQARSASTTTPGGSTRRCTRSRPAPAITDIRITTRYFSRAPRRPVRDDARVRPRPLRAPGRPGARAQRRSRAASRSACTSRRAGCGRTSSAARCRSGATSSRGCRSSSPTRSPATTPSGWYREVNAVEPSLIRVEADEATYNLHIILRFELEQAMLADEFPLEQLPEEWNRRMWDYLGIEVPDDTEGVLQDVHWSGGSIGYFPTYALGNLISAQIWEKITADLPDLDDELRAGRVRAAARLAARAPAPPRPQVHARRDARARRRHGRDRSGAVRALPARRSSPTSTASPRPRSPGRQLDRRHGEDTRWNQRIRPDRPQLLPRRARARRRLRDRRVQRPRRREHDGAPAAHDSVLGRFPEEVEVEGGSLRSAATRCKGSPSATRPRCRGATSGSTS